MSVRLRTVTIFAFVFVTSLAVSVGAIEPITGVSFDSLIAAQDTLLQRELDSLLQGIDCFACGPIDPLFDNDTGLYSHFRTTRLICADQTAAKRAEDILRAHNFTHTTGSPIPARPYEGAYIPNRWSPLRPQQLIYPPIPLTNKWTLNVQLCTWQQNRYLVWLHRVAGEGWFALDKEARTKYEGVVYRYLMNRASNSNFAPPRAEKYSLPDRFDLFPESPDYVIQGYQNYKDYLNAHAGLTTEFASGITAFVPTAATLDRMKANAPREAYPNKEAITLQEEYRQFFERGGDLRMIQTLTKSWFDTLKSGEYTFAVGLNGTIRFARETPPDEVERIKKETGHAPPRANHTFLFSGDAVLTAGVFFIDERADQKLVKVNTRTGHYFYSNITESIREDIAERSDHYLLTLGHFFIALDRIGISYDGILVSKF